jgi:hypothetical protein
MSFDIDITVSDLGADPTLGERVFEALLDAAPEYEPVVSQDLEAGTLSASLSCDAESPGSAAEKATTTFHRAAATLGDRRLVATHAEPLRAA